jgi:hypothetical protein
MHSIITINHDDLNDSQKTIINATSFQYTVNVLDNLLNIDRRVIILPVPYDVMGGEAYCDENENYKFLHRPYFNGKKPDQEVDLLFCILLIVIFILLFLFE